VVVVDVAGEDVPDALRKGARPPTGAAAYVCRGMQCLPPITDVARVEAELAPG
jgi:uncharacterized protein YyaL (SSP411 family)